MSSTTEGPCSAAFKNNPMGTEHYANLDPLHSHSELGLIISWYN